MKVTVVIRITTIAILFHNAYLLIGEYKHETVGRGIDEQYNLRLWRHGKIKSLRRCNGFRNKNPIALAVGVSKTKLYGIIPF